MNRQLISSGSPYEPVVGFSRAVRVGNFVSVGGTAPIGEDGKTVAPETRPGKQGDALILSKPPWKRPGPV